MKEYDFPGEAVYALVPEGDTFLGGVGYWDRRNTPHTNQVKEETLGGVFRRDPDGEVVGRSQELPNLVYSLVGTGDGLFTGCRNGRAYMLDSDLKVNEEMELGVSGIYMAVITEDRRIVMTLREGAVLSYDLRTGRSEKNDIVDSGTRLWPITQRDDRFLVGSYRGEIALLDPRLRIEKGPASFGRSSVWALEYLKGIDRFIMGNASGHLYILDRELHVEDMPIKGWDAPFTSSTAMGPEAVALGDFDGNVIVLDFGKGSNKKYEIPEKEEPRNTIWSMNYRDGKLFAGYSNGQVRVFDVRQKV